ncbi:hypothetical protein [Streptomyces sp. NPDC050534]|uniref:hypothetical protein n=1 Tax=Streptomyces sp. NPDC050534 TaxID=3365625 RepID=UPI0037AAE2CF
MGRRTLQVSYDDGASWRAVPLTGGRGTLTVPRDASYISVRAAATDDRGGSVTQEIIRAVGVR